MPLVRWAARIRERWQASVTAIIAVGTDLLAAKDELDHGQWERMFRGHRDAVANPVPFTSRMARKLMQIARHPVLSESEHCSDLPASWTTLHELSKVDEATLRQALADGRVHAGMELKDVAALLPALPPDPEPPLWDGTAAFDRICIAIAREFERCPPEARPWLASVIHARARGVLAHCGLALCEPGDGGTLHELSKLDGDDGGSAP
jgi:hypothetical protein